MIKRYAFASIGALVSTVALNCGSSLVPSQPLDKPFPSNAKGEEHYAKYCSLCHGEQGEGYRADEATALSSQDFLIAASDRYIAENTHRGRPGTPMSAWGREFGGALDRDEINDVVSHLRSWQREAAIDVSRLWKPGNATRGGQTYARNCETCHGIEGKGGTALTLNNEVFQKTASPGFIGFTIEHGRRQTKMPGFGRKLTQRKIRDLIAHVKEMPTDDTFSRLFSSNKEEPTHGARVEILFPQNPPADFTMRENRFVKANDVFQAYQQKLSFLIIDARPHSDYLIFHIDGAVSIPFYDVESRLAEIPKDLWVITYCGCPHAISGRALDILRAHGYTKSAVLDEGIYVWNERGYPITSLLGQ